MKQKFEPGIVNFNSGNTTYFRPNCDAATPSGIRTQNCKYVIKMYFGGNSLIFSTI